VQLDLLTDTPRARTTDPATSHRAAARVRADLGRQQQLVLDWVQCFPGHTSAELAQEIARARDDDPRLWPKYRPMLGRRLPELVPVHARKGGARRCEVTGEECITWYAM
jgi:hypothetical protein